MGQRPPHPDIKQQVIIYLLLFLFYKDVAAWAKGRLMAPASFLCPTKRPSMQDSTEGQKLFFTICFSETSVTIR